MARVAELSDETNDEPIVWGAKERLKYKYDDEQQFSITSLHQTETENQVEPLLLFPPSVIKLRKEVHFEYLKKAVFELPRRNQYLDCSQPWLCYWILHSLDLLEDSNNKDNNNINASSSAECPFFSTPPVSTHLLSFLSSCSHSKGGYGGGKGQIGHLAPSYAAINAICVIGTEEAYQSVDRKGVYEFLLSRKHSSGGFSMHDQGEVDVRATYCAISIASILNLLDDALTLNTSSFILSCQTYEGGFGAEPGNEAHGGYSFCALAAAVLINCHSLLNLPRLLEWVTQRQMVFEGGFQGRTNKLVDSCYSFWQGALFPILSSLLPSPSSSSSSFRDAEERQQTGCYDEKAKEAKLLCNQRMLQEYILLCAQMQSGGFRDKPSKSVDFYHTCYSLNGLSIAQHNGDQSFFCVGGDENRLKEIDPLHGVALDKIQRAKQYFSSLPHPRTALN